MRFLVPYCAGMFTPECRDIKRFHWTCLFCRFRRQWLGKWRKPEKLISWVLPWTIRPDQPPQAVMIDPRGNIHFKFFRCCAIICFISLANKFHQCTKTLQPNVQSVVCSMTVKKLMNASELLANLTW